ncbi:UDP-N-acetylmuramoyl-tripeptide--D-alanyl-D-alanine ligase, partial [Desulfobacterales bacterium HSG17]|nr:UDP-N-acetylmuramoyl-tripeptide--D-alanyl-D-alanine ligase [Desulfobacterales bacterium HSG17]
KGQIHDGHKFIEDVVDKDIKGLLLNINSIKDLPLEKWKDSGIACIAVKDTVQSLGSLGRFNLERASVSVTAITGSNGKTTTRAMCSAIAQQKFNTLSTYGNYNNEIGLPLTLFNLNPDHEWAVLELGMNHTGEIKRLTEICQPDIGVITNIGPAHIGELGSMDAIMNAKGELLQGLKTDGTAVLNADDPRCMKLAENLPKAIADTVIFFGMSDNAHIKADSIKEDRTGISFVLNADNEEARVHLNVQGRFMVYNALAAAAVGSIMKLSVQEIRAGLENFTPVKGRMNILKTLKGIVIIDDTYNANPESMKAAIDTFHNLKHDNNRNILVVGDMFELGEHAEAMHKEIGEKAAEAGVSKLFAAGSFAGHIAKGAMKNGMSSKDIFQGSREEIIEELKNTLSAVDLVLIKGSRGMAMEKIVNSIREWADK